MTKTIEISDKNYEILKHFMVYGRDRVGDGTLDDTLYMILKYAEKSGDFDTDHDQVPIMTEGRAIFARERIELTKKCIKNMESRITDPEVLQNMKELYQYQVDDIQRQIDDYEKWIKKKEGD